jgi:molecular chaperone GrpE
MEENKIVEPVIEGEAENEGKKSVKKKTADKELLKKIEQLTEKNKKLADEFLSLEKKADEYKQSWYRTAADFENYKKRNAETRANAYLDGKFDVLKSILPIGDNLDRALATVKDEQTKVGLELVIKQFNETLKNIGVEELNPVGEVFDPNLHEAVFQAECENPEDSGKIQSVFKKGYALNGKMIRYAQVIVNK